MYIAKKLLNTLHNECDGMTDFDEVLEHTKKYLLENHTNFEYSDEDDPELCRIAEKITNQLSETLHLNSSDRNNLYKTIHT